MTKEQKQMIENPFIPIAIVCGRMSGKSESSLLAIEQLFIERRDALIRISKCRTRLYKMKRNIK